MIWTAQLVLWRATSVVQGFTGVAYADKDKVYSWGKDGQIAEVDGLRLVALAKRIVERDLYRHFEAHVLAALGLTAPIGVIRAEMGWSASSHDRKLKQAAEKLAEYLNENPLPLDGGKSATHPFRMGEVVQLGRRGTSAASPAAQVIAFPTDKKKPKPISIASPAVAIEPARKERA